MSSARLAAVGVEPIGEQLDVGERRAVTREQRLRLERREPLEAAEVLKERAAARGFVAADERGNRDDPREQVIAAEQDPVAGIPQRQVTVGVA